MSEWGVTLEPGLQGLSDEARFGPDAREKGTVFLVEETRRAEAWWWGLGGRLYSWPLHTGDKEVCPGPRAQVCH